MKLSDTSIRRPVLASMLSTALVLFGAISYARLPVHERAVVIPEDAVLPLQGEFLVWVVASDRAERRTVELGVRAPGFVEVLRGVSAGEDVVVGGAERLSEGVSVRATRVERAGGSS
jgi:membrane fusion protein (multidrug efflux system)